MNSPLSLMGWESERIKGLFHGMNSVACRDAIIGAPMCIMMYAVSISRVGR